MSDIPYGIEDTVRLIVETVPVQPTSVAIDIYSPSGTKILDAATCIYDSTEQHWYYDWTPSSGGHGSGEYKVISKATVGSKTNTDVSYFCMKDYSA